MNFSNDIFFVHRSCTADIRIGVDNNRHWFDNFPCTVHTSMWEGPAEVVSVGVSVVVQEGG